MVDAVVIGAGPNGLVAAATLARRGWRVVLLEAQSRPGGALYSEELTLPGYLHDVGAAFFPFAESPAFRSLDLAGLGLRWGLGRRESCHPAPDGTSISIARELPLSIASFGVDGRAWERLAEWQQRMGQRLVETLLAPLPSLEQSWRHPYANLRHLWRLGLPNLVRFSLASMRSPATFSERIFQTAEARRVIPGLALHVDLGPDDFAGTGLGMVLALLASWSGFRVPIGGSRALAHALLKRVEEAGGILHVNTRVQAIVVRGQRAVAVKTYTGEEIGVRRAVLADVGAPSLYLDLLPERAVARWLRWRMRRFRYGWGTFKMDWALSGPVPWSSAEARESAVVHAGDSVADLRAFTQEVRSGRLPSNPYLVIGQQSLLDPTRAPPGGQTLWAYSHVPSQIDGGWHRQRESFADRIEQRIEGLALGFRGLIRARAIHTPDDLQAMDENLVGGDLGGGTAHVDHQLFFRPVFPHYDYRTPVRGLYLISASAHPGAGVHGHGGYNGALAALEDQQTQ